MANYIHQVQTADGTVFDLKAVQVTNNVNIKTINSETLVGSGNIALATPGAVAAATSGLASMTAVANATAALPTFGDVAIATTAMATTGYVDTAVVSATSGIISSPLKKEVHGAIVRTDQTNTISISTTTQGPIVFGEQNTVGPSVAKHVFVNGYKNAVATTASMSCGIVAGQSNKVSGSYNATFGYGNQNSHDAALVAGRSLISGKLNQAVVGQYNKSDSTAQFIVGVGTDTSNRANGLVAYATGVYAPNLLAPTATSTALSPGAAGQVLTATGTGLQWKNPDAGVYVVTASYGNYKYDDYVGEYVGCWYVPVSYTNTLETLAAAGTPIFLSVRDNNDTGLDITYALSCYYEFTPEFWGIASDNSTGQIKACNFNTWDPIYDPATSETVGYMINFSTKTDNVLVVNATYKTLYDYEGVSVSGWFLNSIPTITSNTKAVFLTAYGTNNSVYFSTGPVNKTSDGYVQARMHYNNNNYIWTFNQQFYDSSWSLQYYASIAQESSGGGGGGSSSAHNVIFTYQYVYDESSENSTEGYFTYTSPSTVSSWLRNNEQVIFWLTDPNFNYNNDVIQLTVVQDNTQMGPNIYLKGMGQSNYIYSDFQQIDGYGYYLQLEDSVNRKADSYYKYYVTIGTNDWNSTTHIAEKTINLGTYIWSYSNDDRQLVSVAPVYFYKDEYYKYGVIASLQPTPGNTKYSTDKIYFYATKIPTTTIYVNVFLTSLY